MHHSLRELGAALSATVVGDDTITVTGAAEPQLASPAQIAIATSPAYVKRLPDGAAVAALLADGTDWQALGLKGAILVKRPRYAMAQMSVRMDHRWRQRGGGNVHPTALIDPTAQIAQGAVIGAYTIIGPNVRIGALAWIGPHVSVDRGTVIGHAPTLAAGVRIGQDVTIGDHFIAHPSVVIGADGFSFVTPEPSAVEHVRDTLGDQGNTKAQGWTRIHSLGSVTIGHNVELGANTCVDRGTIRDTQVGDGCKCDNLAQIGHNVIIGRDVMICAQVGIAGSSRIGNNVVLGGQTGVSDNTYIGDNVITGGATKVLANVPAGRVVLGYPAVKMDQQLEIHRALRKLPQLLRDMAFLKKSVSKGDQTP